MKLDKSLIARLAEHLETCELEARDTTKITDEHPQMDWDDAYAIQDEIRRRKLARGSRLVGLKCGLTSRAKMKQMGVETPCWGFLVDDYVVADGGEIDCKRLIHPKIEPEIVFVTKAALQGPGCHIGAVMAATDFVMPGMEVIDSRYRDFKFDLKSVVADNCSGSRFAVLFHHDAQGAQVERIDAGHAPADHEPAARAVVGDHAFQVELEVAVA